MDSNKPLSIAMEEIAAGKIVIQYPGEARRAADGLLGGERGAAGEWDTESPEAGSGAAERRPAGTRDELSTGGEATVLSLDTADEDL